MKDFFLQNIVAGISHPPTFWKLKVFVPFILFASFSFSYGLLVELFQFGLLESNLIFILPLTLFIFPSLLEELFFRGLFIPYDLDKKSNVQKVFWISISTFLFVLWHPINALTINKGAQSLFLNPHFLLIVTLLGITCSYTYMRSKSLWVPILIHWITIVVWVFVLGGRNLILQ